MFVKDIGQMQGLPECNVIDRMSLFVSGFWNTVTQQLNIGRTQSIPFFIQKAKRGQKNAVAFERISKNLYC